MSIERLKKIAAKGERWPKGAEIEVLIALPKLLAVVQAGDEIFSYLKAYSSEHGGRVGQVPPGFEYKMHAAMERWAESRSALDEETK